MVVAVAVAVVAVAAAVASVVEFCYNPYIFRREAETWP